MFTKFLDPKNDYAFKKIFGSEKNKDILIHFLNDVVVFREGGKIQEVSFLKTTQDPETAAQKASLVDILCIDEKGTHYVVEMQVAKDEGFEKRAQYYASKVYTSQMQRGQPFHSLKEVIFLAIVDFVMFPSKPGYKSDHVILDKKSHENDLKDFSFTFIELPKFTKPIASLEGMTEKWIYFFKYADETSGADFQKLIGEDFILGRVYEELNSIKWNQAELLTYEKADMIEKFQHGCLLHQRIEGKAEGMAEGMAQGMTRGIEEGKMLVAIQMLQDGIDEATICRLTHFSRETLKQIEARLDKKIGK
jgi:predicted transposase/invertase (TIGR01784 family)